MTKIIVDKKIALLAVMKFFNIPILGTEPEYYVSGGNPHYPVDIEFDFEAKDDNRR